MVEIDEHVSTRLLVKEAEPGKEVRLMDGNDSHGKTFMADAADSFGEQRAIYPPRRTALSMDQRIDLTPLQPEDSSTLYAWINDREQVILNAAWHPVSRSAHDSWFEKVQIRTDSVIFAIRLRDDQRLIGTCQLHDIHPVHRHAELQIRIGVPSERGRGLGTEALRRLLSFGFSDLNLHRVTLKVFASNERAIRAYENVGFVQEGVMRKMAHVDGRYVDVVVMGILRDEYTTA
jgi:RimJ/RimL family protein N-acetyltransferase